MRKFFDHYRWGNLNYYKLYHMFQSHLILIVIIALLCWIL